MYLRLAALAEDARLRRLADARSNCKLKRDKAQGSIDMPKLHRATIDGPVCLIITLSEERAVE